MPPYGRGQLESDAVAAELAAGTLRPRRGFEAVVPNPKLKLLD